jgi:hypothetical protein
MSKSVKSVLMNYLLTKHAKDVCKRLGITEGFAYLVCKIGTEYPSKNHLGQMRHSGLGLCVVTEENKIITIYKDKVITPLRPDQLEKGEQIRRIK